MKQCVEAIISWLIKCNAINSEDKELYNYALYSMFLSLSPILLALFWGIFFKCPLKSLLIVFPFMLIRKYSGGYHTKNLWSCLVWSTILLLLCILVCIHLENKEIYWPIVLLASASLVCFSPIDNENRRLTESERNIYKKQTITIVTSFLLILSFLYIKQLFRYFICISIGITLSACLQIPSLIGVNKNKIMKKKTKNEIIFIGIIIMWIVSHDATLVYAEKYEYDALNRVTKVIYEDGSTVEYTYDKNGNILSTVIYDNKDKNNNEDDNGAQKSGQNGDEEREDDGSESATLDSGGAGNGSSPGSGGLENESGSTGSGGSGALTGAGETQKESGSSSGSQGTGIGQNTGAVPGTGESGALEMEGTPETGNISGNENAITSENGGLGESIVSGESTTSELSAGETFENKDPQVSAASSTADSTGTGNPDAQGWLHRLFVSIGRAVLKIADFLKSLFS